MWALGAEGDRQRDQAEAEGGQRVKSFQQTRIQINRKIKK